MFLILCICFCIIRLDQELEKLKFGMQQNLESDPKTWVLLVAGSKGYINYRHQVKSD